MKKLLFFLLTALTICAFSDTATPRCAVIGQKNFYNFSDLARLYRMQEKRSGNTIRYFYKGVCRVEVTPGQRTIRVNGVAITLANNIVNQSGQPFISASDWNATMRILLNPRRTTTAHKIRTIVLDPGHGGKDHGTAGKSVLEKDLAMRIARKTALMLKSCGFRVVMTRNSDVKIPLAERPAIAKRYGGDLFVSIHLNAAADRRVNGVETYCLTPAGMLSSNDAKKKGSTAALPGNRFDANNILLASCIHRQVLFRTRAADRSVKRARFAVLNDLSMPGILIEAGFLSNRAEEQKLIRDEYVDNIARSIVAGILEYQQNIPAK